MIPEETKKRSKKGMALIALGVLLLVFNGWVTIRIITLLLGLLLINYGLIKMGEPSLINYARAFVRLFKFW